MPAITEIRDSQRASWNRFSRGWRKWDTFVMNWLAPVGEAIVEMAQLPPNARVLDVATGTGEPGLTAAKRLTNGSVLAVDVAEDMISVARDKSAAAGIKNYVAESYDGFRMPNGPFDAVIARFGIMFFPDVEAGLKEIRRVLKKGGRLSAGVWLGPQQNPWAAIPGKIVSEIMKTPPPAPDAPGMFRCAAPDFNRDLFQKAGFIKIEEREINGTLTFRDAEHFWEYLNDIVAPVVMALSTATLEQRQAVKKAVSEAVASFKTDKGLVFPWTAKVTAGEAA